MADLYVCPTCKETEDCACSDLSRAKRTALEAEREVRRALGWLAVRLVQQMPDACTACASMPIGKRCAMCVQVAFAKKQIEDTLPKRTP